MNKAGNPKSFEKLTSLIFIFISIVFMLIFAYVASISHHAGSPDSRNNLDTARNIAQGKGFTTNMVQQLYVEQKLPGPDPVRTPGVPYAYTVLYMIFGFNYWVQIVLNGLLLIIAAWVLRNAMLRITQAWFANLAGILFLISGNFYMDELISNPFLILMTVLFLMVFTSNYTKPWNSYILAFTLAAISFVGFQMKPTNFLTAIPVSLFILLADLKSGSAKPAPISRKSRYAGVLIYLIIFAVSISPYLVFNQANFGKPLGVVHSALRLVDRYGGLPYGTWYTVRIDKPVTYSEVKSVFGMSGLVKKEIILWVRAGWKLFIMNPAIVLFVFCALIALGKKLNWKLYIPAFLLMIEPVFVTAFFWRVEIRFLWPVYPCLLFMTGLIISDFTRWSESITRTKQLAIYRNIFIVLIILSLLFSLKNSRSAILTGITFAKLTIPTWIEPIKQTPPDSVILTDDPWSVAWLTEHKSVICPAGSRDDLDIVLNMYKPDYLLITGRAEIGLKSTGLEGYDVALKDSEIELIDSGESYNDFSVYKQYPWKFYRIINPVTDSPK
jgi:hypothetical protein